MSQLDSGIFGIELKCLSPDRGERSNETQRKDNTMKKPETRAELDDHTKNQSQLLQTSYARELRAVGQALEARHVVSLDLELKGGLYVVRGKVNASDYAQSSLSAFMQDFISGVGSVFTGASRRSLYEIDLSYNPQDVEKLDSQGREHRHNAARNPDPYALAQKLRGVGSFLDYRPETTLTGISVEDRWVTVRYKTAEGHIEQAKQDVAYFYNYWVKMYLRRGLRQNLELPDDPTLVVNWGTANQERNNPS
jgi:hypothetical protein